MIVKLIKENYKKIKFFKELFEEVEKSLDKMQDFFQFMNAKPNALLGDIPLFILSTSYSQDNEVTGYKSFLKENFNENVFVNPYTLNIETMVFGKTFLENLEKLLNKSKERKYTMLVYEKMKNKVFGPLVITSISYEEGAENQTQIKVKITLKEVNLLEFTTKDGVTTTGVYDPNAKIKNVEPEELKPAEERQTEIFIKDGWNV